MHDSLCEAYSYVGSVVKFVVGGLVKKCGVGRGQSFQEPAIEGTRCYIFLCCVRL